MSATGTLPVNQQMNVMALLQAAVSFPDAQPEYCFLLKTPHLSAIREAAFPPLVTVQRQLSIFRIAHIMLFFEKVVIN